MRRRRTALSSVALLALASPARAHDGPPFPILVDWEVEDTLVSIWADPDVGIGSFYVYVERDGEPALPDGFELELLTHPIDDVDLVREAAAVLPRRGEAFQLFLEVPFDFIGTWRTTFRWKHGERSGERELDLEVTPPGFGPIDILWYLFPFLGVGFLWAKALLRRRAPRGSSPAPPSRSRSNPAKPVRPAEPTSPDTDSP